MFVNQINIAVLVPLVFVALETAHHVSPFNVVPAAETVVNNPVVPTYRQVSVTLPAATLIIPPGRATMACVNGDIAGRHRRGLRLISPLRFP